MRGMMRRGMGSMMDDMSLMNGWLGGKTIPLDLATKRPPEDERSINAGKGIYEVKCAVCHGLKGDGKGDKAGELLIKPRDFSLGLYKFRSTPSGAPPTDDDIFKTISRGLHGTAMLPWLGLTTTQKWLVTYYVKTFSDFFAFYYEDGNKQIIVKMPPTTKSKKEYIALGKKSYKKAKCFECHGDEGYGDGEAADKLKDDWQNPIRPANLREQIPKRGLELEELYLTLATGLNGSPMPSYLSALTEEEVLSLAYFVRSIAPKPKSGGMKMMGGMMTGDFPQDVQAGMMIDHVMMPVELP